MNIGVSEPIFTCIRTISVVNFQRRVKKESNMPYSMEKKIFWKPVTFTFCLLQFWSCDQSDYADISQRNSQFLAERALRSI